MKLSDKKELGVIDPTRIDQRTPLASPLTPFRVAFHQKLRLWDTRFNEALDKILFPLTVYIYHSTPDPGNQQAFMSPPACLQA